jgi:hypothetical protein
VTLNARDAESAKKLADSLEQNLAQVKQRDVKRDKAQDRARALKTLGWLALGFGLQIVAAYLNKPPA